MTRGILARDWERGDPKVLAQRRIEAVRSIARQPRRRKRKSMFRLLIQNRMACVLLVAMVASFLLSVYVSAYAGVTQKGYQKGELLARLKDVQMEGAGLRFKLEGLRQPDHISAFALGKGMVQGEKMEYLRPHDQPRMAQNTERGDTR